VSRCEDCSWWRPRDSNCIALVTSYNLCPSNFLIVHTTCSQNITRLYTPPVRQIFPDSTRHLFAKYFLTLHATCSPNVSRLYTPPVRKMPCTVPHVQPNSPQSHRYSWREIAFRRYFTSHLCNVNMIYSNNCPTGCNTKQTICYSASSLYMFRVSTTPIISTQNCNYILRCWLYFLGSFLPPPWPSLGTLVGGSCTVQKTVITVLFTPDNECGWHPKHVQWTCRTINRLFCVASRWTVIDIDQRCTEP